jgi:L,D-transpeptidase YcbB
VLSSVKPLKYVALTLFLLPHLTQAQETVLRCETVTDSQSQRVVCEQRPVTSDFKVPLPHDAPMPIFSSEAVQPQGEIKVPLPEDVSAIAIILPVEPSNPILQDTKTPEVRISAMPADSMQAALSRLAAAKRLDKTNFDELSNFYKERNFAPLWLKSELKEVAWSEQVKAIRNRLSLAREDGLDPARYRSIASIVESNRAEWPALAAAEIELSAAILLYVNDVSLGRVIPRQVHAMITPNLERIEAGVILKRIAASKEPGQTLHEFSPPQKGYRQLRESLAELRKQQNLTSGIIIPDGPVLRVGMRDWRVSLIRLKLGIDGTGDSYDRDLAAKIAEFQRSVRLLANTVITPQTIRALNGERHSVEEADIITNMEFWRWLPRNLGKDHIFVNVPSYGLQYMKNDQLVHEARVIVGTDETQTPIFSDQMDHIVVNPSWFVPPSILKKDPRYLDPEWVKARGYTMIKRRNSVIVRVPPGASNALGYVKFMFPNDHAVYLHDTPQRRLFNANSRVLSNGCVRVEDPFKLAAKIFETAGWSEDRFKRMIGSGEQRMNLPAKLPIHLAYFTLAVDSNGALVRHRDVYGHAARLKQLLGLS